MIDCEKPMATCMGDARRMVAACERHGVLLGISHQRRHVTHQRRVRQHIREGTLGEIRFIQACCWGGFADPMWVCTHFTDMIIYYAGPVRWVMGQVRGLSRSDCHRGVKIRPTGFICQMGFVSGAQGIFMFGDGSEPYAGFGPMRIVGDKGEIRTPLDGQAQILKYDGGALLDIDASDMKGWDFWAAFTPNINDLVDACEQGREPLCNAREAAMAHEILFATYDSARCGGRIDLPMTTEDNPLELMAAEGWPQAGNSRPEDTGKAPA
jgi:predicted dehydrogenase